MVASISGGRWVTSTKSVVTNTLCGLDAYLADVDVEGRHHLDVEGSVAADLPVEKSHRVCGRRVAVVVDPLDEGARAVPDADDCDAD